MHCPYCGARESRVLDTRLSACGQEVRRRRACTECDARFTTYERCELEALVIKRDGRKEIYDESKIRHGLERALGKRSLDDTLVHAAIANVSRLVHDTRGKQVESQQIGSWLLEELRKLDQVAYVRFASVYLGFNDASAFREVLDRLEVVSGEDQQSIKDAPSSAVTRKTI